MDQYPTTHAGKKHFLAEKSLNLVWLRVPDRDMFQRIAQQVETSPSHTSPAVKCETESSGISSFLEAYRDLLWGMRYIFTPVACVSLALVISNAISISVRERRLELAVMKVLGFRPAQILFMVLGEALLLGVLSGLASAGLTWWVVNSYFGGVKFPIAFFPKFLIPDDAWVWGPMLGGGAALLGTLIPAWNACRVKVTDVFARVT
jgi:putative ABC transport system permease protein